MNGYSAVVFLATLLAVYSSPLADECTVTSYDNVATALSNCTTLVIDGITVPAGETLKLGLNDGASLTFKGTIKFDYAEWAGPLITIQGQNVTVDGSGATFDGQGAKYWDGKGTGGKKKPRFLFFRLLEYSHISNIHLLDCPLLCVYFYASFYTTLSSFTIDVSAGDSAGGANTDGFYVAVSGNITIENSIVKNQGDCVAVQQGSYFVFRNITCSGGHGLSLSVGQTSVNGVPNTVNNVQFTDCTVSNSTNGIQIKTHVDSGTGAVSDITYKNIKLSGITNYGINVQQDYINGSASGIAGNNIPINNLVLNNVKGTMSGGSSAMPVYILCGSNGCSSWPWSDVSITNGNKSNECNFTPSGFSC